jgi:hypothetical protein
VSSKAFDYGRRFREIEQHMVDEATGRWNKKGPADLSGATLPSSGLGRDPVPSVARSGGRPPRQYSESDMRPSRPGTLSTETEFDRLQKRVGILGIDNEVLRDLLEVAYSTVAILSADQGNAPAEAFRERIWAHLHDEEAACPNCDHYIVNHEAAGPCAVYECECQTNGAALHAALDAYDRERP